MRIITQRKEKEHMNVKDMACDEIKTDFENLKEVELGSEEFKTSVDGITKLMDRYIEMEKHDDEVKAREIDRKFDQELKRKQARDERIDRWIKNGCVAVGVGGDLTAPAKSGDYAAVTELARQFVEKVANARKN